MSNKDISITHNNVVLSALAEKVDEKTGEVYQRVNVAFMGGENKYMKYYGNKEGLLDIGQDDLGVSGMVQMSAAFETVSGNNSSYVAGSYRPKILIGFVRADKKPLSGGKKKAGSAS